MSWDPTWEQVFRAREWGRYPPEELIRFVARHFYAAANRKEVKILELGCGVGANMWYLAREGFDAYGIDGSETAIAKAGRRLQGEGLQARLQAGDIISLGKMYPESHFDAVIDVACLSCNTIGDVQAILDQVPTVLKPQGRVFSLMLEAGSYGDGLGKQVEPGTYVDITEGPFAGVGRCHFFTLDEVRRLFGHFGKVQIEASARSLNNRQQWDKLWVIEGVKGEAARS